MHLPLGSWIVRNAARFLSLRERDAVLGDLAEAHTSTARSLGELAGLLLARQKQAWSRGSTWFALAAVTLPVAALLGVIFGRVATLTAIYGWLYAGNWTSLYLAPGFRGDLAHHALVCGWACVSVASVAWTVGVLISSISRSALAANAAMALLVTAIVGALVFNECAGSSTPNASVLHEATYRVWLPSLLLLAVVIAPGWLGRRASASLIACSRVTHLGISALAFLILTLQAAKPSVSSTGLISLALPITFYVLSAKRQARFSLSTLC
jgi:hypothetical protein